MMRGDERVPATTEQEGRAAKRNYEAGQYVAQWMMVLVTLGAVIAAVVYAYWAWKQVEVMRGTEFAEMRPYVELGDSKHSPIELTKNSKTNKSEVTIYFHNYGRTPALHFSSQFYGSIKGVEEPGLRFLTRYKDLTSGALMTYPMTNPPRTLAPDTTDSESVDDKWLPTPDMIDGKGEQPLLCYAVKGATYDVSGNFEYCDVFGQYHCGSFTYCYSTAASPQFAETWPYPCNEVVPAASAPTPPSMAMRGLHSHWIELPRCEQLDEMQVDQGGPRMER